MAVHSEIPPANVVLPKQTSGTFVPPGTLAAEISTADIVRLTNSDVPSLEMVDQLYTQTTPTMDANTQTPVQRVQQLGR